MVMFYLIHNQGTNDEPRYDAPQRILAGDKPVDVFGMPSPQFADFDDDGDLDLICGEFLDGFTWFANVGSRTKPRYATGQRLVDADDQPVTMDLQMITPTAIDWDRDGDVDLICGDEDRPRSVHRTYRARRRWQARVQTTSVLPTTGRLREVRRTRHASKRRLGRRWGRGHSGRKFGRPHCFHREPWPRSQPPHATLECAKAARSRRKDAANHGTARMVRFKDRPKRSGVTRRLSAADWDHDGLPDLVVNSIWGKVVWYRNIGTRTQPMLAAAKPITVPWKERPPKPSWNWWNPAGSELVTQWRTTPVVTDWDEDGLHDLVMLDHEGYLAWFRRERRGEELALLPGRRDFHGGEFDRKGSRLNREGPLRLNNESARTKRASQVEPRRP